MRHFLIHLFVASLCMTSAYAQEKSSNWNINDNNLHMMRPKYGFPYGVPKVAQVKNSIDRVIDYLDRAMPAGVTNGRLQKGALRQTSYESGVLYSAVIDAAQRTGNKRYMNFAESRFDDMAELASAISDSLHTERQDDPQMDLVVHPNKLDDAGAMCAAYCRFLLVNPRKPAYNAVIRRYMTCIRKQLRIGDDHIFARERPYHHSVWLDDMYMGIPALAWYGCLKGDSVYIIDAINQIKAFKIRMWVPESHLFRHGWIESMDPHPFFPWGRANGWAILTMCQVLDAMQFHHARLMENKQTDYSRYQEDHDMVVNLLRQHISGLCSVQDKTGLWHQLLNDPSSYLETSASAIYTYCLAHAICEKWIDVQTYGAQTLLAWNGISTQINIHGQVENTCVGTGMGFDRAFYCYRPVHVLACHGYGPMIWAGSEIIRMLHTFHPSMHDSAIHF